MATYNAARLLGKQATMGSIETGKVADAVLLSADPTIDIGNAKAIVMVMKAGEIVDESRLPLAGGPQRETHALTSGGAGDPPLASMGAVAERR